jgi:rubrerythrin
MSKLKLKAVLFHICRECGYNERYQGQEKECPKCKAAEDKKGKGAA